MAMSASRLSRLFPLFARGMTTQDSVRLHREAMFHSHDGDGDDDDTSQAIPDSDDDKPR
jgi:hypothetical protein